MLLLKAPPEDSKPDDELPLDPDVPSTSTGITRQPSIDEDQLVKMLVQALIERGDQYERSLNVSLFLFVFFYYCGFFWLSSKLFVFNTASKWL